MKRGPKSKSELSVLVSLEDSRPLPPDELNSEQKELWQTIAGRLPKGYFPPETWDVLAAYCKHVSSERFLAAEIDRWEREWLKDDEGLARFDKLLKMRDRETRAMLTCARSLRITNQARQDPKTAGRASRNSPLETARPWDGVKA